MERWIKAKIKTSKCGRFCSVKCGWVGGYSPHHKGAICYAPFLGEYSAPPITLIDVGTQVRPRFVRLQQCIDAEIEE